MEYLVFRLYGPMASWGQAAVGGDRPTAMAPGKAAIIGLLGAALGVERDDEAGQQRLFDTIVVAVKPCCVIITPYKHLRRIKNSLITAVKVSCLAQRKN